MLYFLMFCFIALVGEGFRTNAAPEWLFSCVFTHVDLQLPSGSFHLATISTYMFVFNQLSSHFIYSPPAEHDPRCVYISLFIKSLFCKRTKTFNIRLIVQSAARTF